MNYITEDHQHTKVQLTENLNYITVSNISDEILYNERVHHETRSYRTVQQSTGKCLQQSTGKKNKSQPESVVLLIIIHTYLYVGYTRGRVCRYDIKQVYVLH